MGQQAFVMQMIVAGISLSTSMALHLGRPLTAGIYALMGIAVLGTVTSTIYFGLVLVASVRHRNFAKGAQQQVERVERDSLPGVCILKPVHGLEPRLRENLESFFRQDYPNFEIIFGTRTPQDPALAVIDELRREYPHVLVKVVYSGEPEWPNAKVFSLDRMIASTRHDFLVISDSDVLVAPDFLRNVITPLLDSSNGLVTCLYRGIPADGLWSHVEALGMSVEMPSGVIVADMLEGMRFALGAVMAVRRDALEKVGGIGATADYYSDDFVLGNLISKAGYRVVLSHHRVGHVLVGGTFAATFDAQLRWAKSTRYSRPAGHVGEGLTYATPFGILALITGCALGRPAMGLALVAWSVLNRMVQALVVGWWLLGDPRALHRFWLFPLRDFLGFFVWASSFLRGSSFAWRGELYRFTPGGRIVPATRKIDAIEEVASR